MILKIYSLYQDAVNHEQAEKRAKEAYTKPAGSNKQQVEEVDEILNMDEDTSFGAQAGRGAKKADRKKQTQQETQ